MPQLLELIIRAKDEASAVLKQITGNSKVAMTDIKAATTGASLGLAGLAAEVAAVMTAYEKIVKPAQDYILAVDELATKGQISREEAAKWAALAALLDIPITTIETAFRTMNENGISPTIGNLQDISEQFLAIEDPVARAQFAVDTFGMRAGPAMAELLEKGSGALETLTTNVGLVVQPTEDATTAAKDLALAQAALETAILNLTVNTGTALMPWAQQVIGMFLVLMDPVDFLKWKLDQLRGAFEDLFNMDGPQGQYGDRGGAGLGPGPKNKTPRERNIPRAGGGEVGTGGDSYMVGERGPEVFSPRTPGHVTSNSDLGALSTSIDRMVKTLPTILIDAIERAK